MSLYETVTSFYTSLSHFGDAVSQKSDTESLTFDFGKFIGVAVENVFKAVHSLVKFAITNPWVKPIAKMILTSAQEVLRFMFGLAWGSIEYLMEDLKEA